MDSSMDEALSTYFVKTMSYICQQEQQKRGLVIGKGLSHEQIYQIVVVAETECLQIYTNHFQSDPIVVVDQLNACVREAFNTVLGVKEAI